MSINRLPVIAHVIHRLNVGGLENGLVNLINNLPADKYRHTIICLTESTDFSQRIQRDDVEIYELHKRSGNDVKLYFKLWKLLRKLRPQIVHTRNLSALEATVVAALARVPIRIHGEHGRDIYDLDGANKKYQLLRRICSPFINKFITMSKDLENWLIKEVGISENKVVQLYNGVDTHLFQTTVKDGVADSLLPQGFANKDSIIVGTVGRLEPVKDQLTLVKAFNLLLKKNPEWSDRLRLVILGDGVLRPEIESLLAEANTRNLVWLAGTRNDVPKLLHYLDIFVLPSLAEGISNTILEAMATSLPIIATNVGGNTELVVNECTGKLVPASDPDSMAKAILAYLEQPEVRSQHGKAGRQRVEDTFSLTGMLGRYEVVYDGLLQIRG